jgi:hypothetical protein
MSSEKVAAGLSGGLGGRIDVFALVCLGQNLFGQQIIGIYLDANFGIKGALATY